jgi:hypothetical protein
MKKVHRLRSVLSLSLLLAGAAAACASPEPEGDNALCEDGSCARSPRTEQSESDSTSSREPRTAPAREGDRTAPTAPTSSAPPPPPPTRSSCSDLARCCPSLWDFADSIACTAVALASNESGCAVALPICKSGGTGIGGLFESTNPKCAGLAQCCDTLEAQGYTTTAASCRQTAQSANEPLCEADLFDFQDVGACP